MDNYGDYEKLIGDWPDDAFGGNIEIIDLPPNLPVIINQVDKEIKIERSDILNSLNKTYGLIDVERIIINKDTISNKLRANAKSILDFVNLLKNGLYLDQTS